MAHAAIGPLFTRSMWQLTVVLSGRCAAIYHQQSTIWHRRGHWTMVAAEATSDASTRRQALSAMTTQVQRERDAVVRRHEGNRVERPDSAEALQPMRISRCASRAAVPIGRPSALASGQ